MIRHHLLQRAGNAIRHAKHGSAVASPSLRAIVIDLHGPSSACTGRCNGSALVDCARRSMSGPDARCDKEDTASVLAHSADTFLGRRAVGPSVRLCALDCMNAQARMPMLFVFESTLDVERLKVTLERTLDAYYPLTGRIIRDSDGHHSVRAIGAGVPFAEATHDAPLSPAAGFTMQHLRAASAAGLYHQLPAPDPDTPLASVKYTSFADGCSILALRTHHWVVDGYGKWLFMRHWSALYNNAVPDVRPVFRRPAFAYPRRPPGIAGASNPSRCDSDDISRGPVPFLDGHFHFTQRRLDTLKEEARSHSANDAMVAYLWQTATKANTLCEATGPANCAIVMDLRGRIPREHIPVEGYSGNAIWVCVPSVPTAAQLREMNLAEISALIRRSVNEPLDPYVIQHHLELLQDIPKPAPDLCPLAFSSWTKFAGPDGTEFFGVKPSMITVAPSYRFDSAFAVLSRVNGGGIAAYIRHRCDILPRLTELLETGPAG